MAQFVLLNLIFVRRAIAPIAPLPGSCRVTRLPSSQEVQVAHIKLLPSPRQASTPFASEILGLGAYI
ncbi:hypothetical protein H6F74_08395 [Trichocoleus sp. FACHB-90]|uniref:hypothetical protein n=1 Tax=Cyanophyceae TaxID=3028117 RepID=UPI001683AD0F|nr:MULTISPECIES: hypothetical protein [unclassified Trichocoleus]MBD1926268.1 hypothetical protein [Trichocoleus sp. FACHB-90]MBD1934601.1 hypothetical protein [Trichocoleus sp. FACHB-69]